MTWSKGFSVGVKSLLTGLPSTFRWSGKVTTQSRRALPAKAGYSSFKSRQIGPATCRGRGRTPLWALLWLGVMALLAIFELADAALPTFENRTPRGFSVPDSTVQTDFAEGNQVTVRVDLNQAATPTFPVIGHFHNLETARQLDTEGIDGARADIALGDDGIVHVAWIASDSLSSVSSPVYHVHYARSNDNGVTFDSPVSVSGTLRFDLLTVNGGGGLVLHPRS